MYVCKNLNTTAATDVMLKLTLNQTQEMYFYQIIASSSLDFILFKDSLAWGGLIVSFLIIKGEWYIIGQENQ